MSFRIFKNNSLSLPYSLSPISGRGARGPHPLARKKNTLIRSKEIKKPETV
jgi:hypothetical protein